MTRSATTSPQPGRRYWWVNQKQTHPQEVGEQYLWSAGKGRRGTTGGTNTSVTSMLPGDVVLSFADAAVRAVGVVLGRAREAPRAGESGTAAATGRGWQVPVKYMALERALVVKEHAAQLSAVLPRTHSPIGAAGEANPKVHLAPVPGPLAAKVCELLAGQVEAAVARIVSSVGAALENDAAEEWIQRRADIGLTEKLNLVRAHRGQGVYRANLELIEQKCRVTGLLDRRHLRASHIKPWYVCDDREKLDGFNGLLLSPHVAHLFDRGYISFSDSGDVLVAQSLNPEVLRSWGIALPRNVGPFRVEQRRYLEYHRREVFGQKWAGGARRDEPPAADTKAPVIGRV